MIFICPQLSDSCNEIPLRLLCSLGRVFNSKLKFRRTLSSGIKISYTRIDSGRTEYFCYRLLT